MTATQIEYFEAVYDSLSFSKAAAMLYVSQPAISKSISNLEKEIGYSLFKRENNVLTLTPAGELFQDFLQRSRKDYSSFLEQLELQKAQSSQTLRVGCPETWDPSHFIDWMQTSFSNAFPEGYLSVEPYRLSDLLMRLKNGKLDFVISHDFYSPSETGLTASPMTETGMGVLYSRKAFPEDVSFKELADRGFLLFDDDIRKRFGSLIMSVCRKQKCEPVIRNGGPVTKCLFELSRGNAVMLFTLWDSFISNQTFGFYPVKDKLPVNLIYYPDRLTSKGRAFIKELRATSKTMLNGSANP